MRELPTAALIGLGSIIYFEIFIRRNLKETVRTKTRLNRVCNKYPRLSRILFYLFMFIMYILASWLVQFLIDKFIVFPI